MTTPTGSPPSRPWSSPESEPHGDRHPDLVPMGAAADGGPLSVGAVAGVAVARGDARATELDDGTDPMEGNPLAAPTVTGPGAVLDGGFRLLRFRFWRLVVLAAAVFLPVQIAQLWVSVSTGLPGTGSDVFGGSVSTAGGTATGGLELAPLAFALGRALALSLLGMAVGHQVAAWLEGRDVGLADTFRFVLSRCWVAPVLVAGGLLVKGPAACLVGIGFFLGDALVFLASVVAGAEGGGPLASLGRSFRLTRAAYPNAVVVVFGGFVISQVLRVALVLGPVALASSFSLSEGLLLGLEQLGLLVLLVAEPLTACIAAQAYVELRCRTEGMDLERRRVARGLV